MSDKQDMTDADRAQLRDVFLKAAGLLGSDSVQSWPYADLVLRTPHCPWCGTEAALMVGANLHPMAFCLNDDCEVVSWDPTITARELLANVVTGSGWASG